MLIRSMGVEKEEPNVKKSLRSFFFYEFKYAGVQ